MCDNRISTRTHLPTPAPRRPEFMIPDLEIELLNTFPFSSRRRLKLGDPLNRFKSIIFLSQRTWDELGVHHFVAASAPGWTAKSDQTLGEVGWLCHWPLIDWLVPEWASLAVPRPFLQTHVFIENMLMHFGEHIASICRDLKAYVANFRIEAWYWQNYPHDIRIISLIVVGCIPVICIT
jgi:hypothetical protein